MATSPRPPLDPDVVADIAVWRAAMDVANTDQRPTGEPAVADAAARWQHQLDTRLEQALGDGARDLARLLLRLDPAIALDPDRLVVARSLNRLQDDGIDVMAALEKAMAQGPLPAEHAASALWYRVADVLTYGPSWPPAQHRWEVVKSRNVPRPESERAGRRRRDRGGPHLGF